MESLFNAEVIKAAASSSLGTLSLMCLILGSIATIFFKKSPVRARIMVFTLLFVGVAGFGYSLMNQKPLDAPPEATREFAIGRWQVDQKVGDMEGGSYVDYNEDGSFSGKLQQFYQGQGQRVPVHGQWNLTKLGKDEFRVTWKFDDGRQSQAVFKILDRNRVQNLDENYVSVRIPR
jgi:hypothetical protein